MGKDKVYTSIRYQPLQVSSFCNPIIYSQSECFTLRVQPVPVVLWWEGLVAWLELQASSAAES